MVEARRLFLGVDGGQSSTRAVIGDQDGRILARAEGGPCSRATSEAGAASLLKMARHLLADALHGAGLPAGSRFEAACYGMSGGPEDKRSVLVSVTPAETIEVTTDAHVALEGAAGGGPGVLIIAGTGSIALARDELGNLARCGGWGYLFGDEGGGFDLVRRALRRALAAEEGWGAATGLGRALQEATGSATVNEAMHRLYDPDWPCHRIASLAPLVDHVAQRGDGPAQQVLQEAGTTLARLAMRAARALPGRSRQLDVFPWGNVLRSSTVRTALAQRLQEEGLTLGRPIHDAATGALLRAYRARGLHVTVQEPQ